MDAQLSQPLISSLNPDYNSGPELKPMEQITGIGVAPEAPETPEWLQDNEITESPEDLSKKPEPEIEKKVEIKTIVNEREILKPPVGEIEGLQDPLPGADKITTVSNTEEDFFVEKVITAHGPN